MRTLYVTCSFIIAAYFFPAFAASPFNGRYCGRGIVTIQGKDRPGQKVIEVQTSETEFRIIRNNVRLDDGSIIIGHQERYEIRGDQLFFRNILVGTANDLEVAAQAHVDEMEIAFKLKSTGFMRTSYERTTRHIEQNFLMIEAFAQLRRSTSCPTLH